MVIRFLPFTQVREWRCIMFHRLGRVLVGVSALLWIFLPMDSLEAQMRLGKWWRIPNVAEQLNLGGKEKEQLDDLFIRTGRKLIDLRSALEKARLELGIMMDKETLDEEAIMGQFKNLDQARANLASERFRFLLEVRKILGAERFQGLKALSWKSKEKRFYGQGCFKRP